MTVLMYDGISALAAGIARDFPNAAKVAGYVDGLYAWSQADGSGAAAMWRRLAAWAFDPKCDRCNGSGTIWDGKKLVRCPKCG